MMNSKVSQPSTSTNIVLWSLITILVAGGIFANFYFSNYPITIRLVGWIILAAILVGLTLQTQFGKSSWIFIKESRMEMRKVTWPTRQETVQTTLVVVAMIVLMALILWGIDSLLLWVIGTLTGHAG
jgi:preprotein translocase subunit SecE